MPFTQYTIPNTPPLTTQHSANSSPAALRLSGYYP